MLVSREEKKEKYASILQQTTTIITPEKVKKWY
jgi:hypothetical protein